MYTKCQNIFFFFFFFFFTADRARDLSKYCDDLLKLPGYLSQSTWVQDQLFGIHEGDIETEINPSIGRPVSATVNNNHNNNQSYDQQPQQYDTAPASPASPVAKPTTTISATIKVKIIYKDEIFAIKVPVTSTIEFLQDKIIDRLGFDVELLYKEKDGRLIELNREIFDSAVKLGKLTVVASTPSA
jgi:bud emergence protein 1